jgi:protein TonB
VLLRPGDSVVPGVLDQPPRAISCPAVRYPESVRQAGIQGRVVFQFVIDTLGRAEPASIQVVQSPHDSMTAAAREALVSCEFTPGRVDGRAVRVLLRLPMDFQFRREADTSP